MFNDNAQPGGAATQTQSPGSDQVQSTAPDPSQQQSPPPEQHQTDGQQSPPTEGQARHDGQAAPDKTAAGKDDERPRPRSRRDERIDGLSRDLNHYRRESEHYRKLYEQSTRQSKPLDRLAFKTEDEFLAATAERAVEKTNHTFAKSQAETAARRAGEAQVQLFNEREADYSEKVPDYRDVAYNPAIPYSRPMLDMISTAENGPSIAYYFGKTPAGMRDAQRISQLPPLDAAYELGRLASTVKPPEQRPAPKAPPPVQTVGTQSGSPSFRPDTNDPAAYARWRRGLK